jgi:hypothetical protein
MTVRVVFVHGSGRVGREAWPLQAATHPDANFVVLPGFGPHDDPVPGIDAAVDRIRSAVGDSAVVVASSFGAIPAARLATEHPAVTGLVLAEPALYAIARGESAVEGLIARMEPVYARGKSGPIGEFWSEAMTTLTGQPTPIPTNPADLDRASRFFAHGAPWDHEIDASALARIPVLVITGGWNQEYEEIAAVLAQHGAERRLLEGHGHRVADHPDFSRALDAFLARIGTEPR